MLEVIKLERWKFKSKDEDINKTYYDFEYSSKNGKTHPATLLFQKTGNFYRLDIMYSYEIVAQEVAKEIFKLYKEALKIVFEKTRIKQEISGIQIVSGYPTSKFLYQHQSYIFYLEPVFQKMVDGYSEAPPAQMYPLTEKDVIVC